MKNLAAVDLNLLVVFEALMAERNVSRAGDRIGLAQPTMSRSLGQLRALFGDELFVRTGREMRPTARAYALADPIAAALATVRATLEQEQAFDPATSQRQITIGATFYANFTMLPGLVRLMRQEAPGVCMFVRALGFRDAIASLDEGKIDLAIGVFADAPKRIGICELAHDRFVCISRRDHPGLSGGLTLEKFIAHAHARWSLVNDPTEAIDVSLAQRHLKRRVALVLQGFYPLVLAVAHSDLLAVVPERVAYALRQREPVDVHELPLEIPPLAMAIAWSKHGAVDAGSRWLRERICAHFARTMVPAPRRGVGVPATAHTR